VITPVFHVGYHTFHPDVSINYQLNRFCDGSPTSVAELTAVGPRIADYVDYSRELLVLANTADLAGRTLAGALYRRSAEFYLLPDDPGKEAARLGFIDSMRTVFGVDAESKDRIPYRDGELGAYRITPDHPASTLVMFGGFDSYMEELFAIQAYFVAAGFDVILFEGPGQGSVLEETQRPMTYEWAPVVSAILDHYHLDGVALVGYSLGGCLAIRAAAAELRIRRVVCDDILTDFAAVTLNQVAPATRRALTVLLALRARRVVNAIAARAMRASLVAEWGLRQGMHTCGATTPYDFLHGTASYETGSVSASVTQDVLLLAGSDDHYIPRIQLAVQLASLTSARSVTTRLFTVAEDAGNHVHIGNVELSLQVISGWLAGLDARDATVTQPPQEPRPAARPSCPT